MTWFAAAVLGLFTLAVLAALTQALHKTAAPAEPALPPEVAAVDRWGIGLYGVGMSVVLAPQRVTEDGMTRTAEALRRYTEDRRFVEVHFFTDEQAARVQEQGRAGRLGERQAWFDRHFVGTYHRNERTGVEEITFAPAGLRLEEPRVIER